MDDDETGLPGELKAAIAVAFGLVLVLALLTLVDLQIKRAIVDQAEQFRREMHRGRQVATEPQGGVPGAVPGLHGVGGVVADGAAAQADGAEATAAPIVGPGDESARPPHRGSVNEG